MQPHPHLASDLPAGPTAHSAPGTRSRRTSCLAAPRMRVLYVEDDSEYANLVQRALRSRGEERFSVHHEGDLDSALALIEHESFDVLLLDLSLPDVERHYTLGTACNMARSLPVVLLTSAEDERYMEAAGRAGACGYLLKSQLDWRALPEHLRRAIVHHEHRS